MLAEVAILAILFLFTSRRGSLRLPGVLANPRVISESLMPCNILLFETKSWNEEFDWQWHIQQIHPSVLKKE